MVLLKSQRKTFHSTGKTTRTAPEGNVDELAFEESVPVDTLWKFAECFFRWDLYG